MTKPSRYRGFLSFDALLSVLPVLLIAMALSWASTELWRKAETHSSDQQAFDKVVSAADHTVKIGAAVREGGVRYPNWIDPGLITVGYIESIQKKSGLDALYISMDPPDEGYRFCVYRIVVIGKEKSLSKLHVCGG